MPAPAGHVFSLRPFVATLALAVGLMSCAAAPIQEMSDARQAIQAAREAGADKSAGGHLQRADQLMTEAEEQLDAGGYRQARERAEAARDEAIKARAAVTEASSSSADKP